MASMRAEHFLYFNNNRIYSEDLVPVKCIYAPGFLGCCPFLVVVDFLFIVTPIVGVCNCSMFCGTLLYVHSSIAIILMGKRELVALLNLSSWCLVMVEQLFLAVPQGCLRFVIVVFPDHTHLLFSYFNTLIILALVTQSKMHLKLVLGGPVQICTNSDVMTSSRSAFLASLDKAFCLFHMPDN